MRKHLITLFLTVPLLLAGCVSGDEGEDENATRTSKATSTTTGEVSEEGSAELADLSEGVEGEIGFRHGMDCIEVSDCSINFTVESLDRMETCEGSAFDDKPEGTYLVKATVLLETKPSATEYLPGEFPIWTDWSALDEDGVNQDLPASSWCSLPVGEHHWRDALQTGDTERRIHIMDVPDGARKIRLTETLHGARWEFPAPDGSNTETGEGASPVALSPAQAPSPTPNATYAPAPAAPAPHPAPAPVVGFTGAPSVETPRVLDKQISHCGDPLMHQTGTTFFTDGTSGWTEACSSQMQQ